MNESLSLSLSLVVKLLVAQTKMQLSPGARVEGMHAAGASPAVLKNASPFYPRPPLTATCRARTGSHKAVKRKPMSER